MGRPSATGSPARGGLDLIVCRFRTSQNANGSWGYHYLLGGGQSEGPAMTCVGLLGLAVGHGLAGATPVAPREAMGPLDPGILPG